MRLNDRLYEPSDLKVLMEKLGDRASSWDDVLRYLDGPGSREAGLAPAEIRQLAEDLRDLKQEGRQFSTDYRDVWRELSALRGAPAAHYSGEQPLERDARSKAAAGDASSRVMDVLRRVQSSEYREMAGLRDSPSRHGSRP